jgi:hypothetical protein
LGIFLRLRTFLELFFNFLGLTTKIPDRRLISEKPEGRSAKPVRSGPRESRDLFARFPKYPGITNYFLIGNPVHRDHAQWTGAGRAVHRELTVARTEGTVALSPELGLRPLRKTEARRQGCNRERGTRGTQRAAHQGVSNGVVAGRQWCRIEGGGAWWKLRSSAKRREERAGEVWSDPGVVLAFYRGRGRLGWKCW